MADAVPPCATWIAAIPATVEDVTPLGTAVVIDDRRVLTSAHMVKVDKRVVLTGLWVAYPMSEDPSAPRRRVRGSGWPRTRWRNLPWSSWTSRSQPGGRGPAALPEANRCGQPGQARSSYAIEHPLGTMSPDRSAAGFIGAGSVLSRRSTRRSAADRATAGPPHDEMPRVR